MINKDHYLAWRISYQSAEQAARSAFDALRSASDRRNIPEEIILMKLLTVVFLSALVLTGRYASADTVCDRIQAAYPETGYWYRGCGPEPGKPYKAELKKDCKQTIRQIIARPGGGWNSEWGWASEEACRSYWPATQTDFVRLFTE